MGSAIIAECEIYPLAGLPNLFNKDVYLLIDLHINLWDFPSDSVVKNSPAVQETQEIQIQPLDWDDLLEKMTIHSNILAWKIPWAGEPGELQLKGSQIDATEGLTTAQIQII